MKTIMSFIIMLSVLSCNAQNSKLDGNTSSKLIIKTVVAAGSVKQNEFGKAADWIEVYNPGENSVDLSNEKWYISDDFNKLKKFRLKKQVVLPQQSITVWCDDQNRVKTENHTNFKLSAYGETVYISKKSGKELTVIDSLSYPAINAKVEINVNTELAAQ